MKEDNLENISPKQTQTDEIALTQTNIERLILNIRGVPVILDRDIASLYGVETKRINEQVKRNNERFPEDFMFQL